MRPHGLCGADDRLLGQIGPVVADILAYCSGEKEGLLWHHPDLPGERVRPELTQVEPVDGDAPFGDVVETHQQRHEGSLAGAGRPDQRDGLPRLDVQANLAQDRTLRLVVETHVLVPHPARPQRPA